MSPCTGSGEMAGILDTLVGLGTEPRLKVYKYSRVTRKLRLVLEGPKLELIYLWVRVPRVSCAWESPAGFKSVSKCRKLHG